MIVLELSGHLDILKPYDPNIRDECYSDIVRNIRIYTLTIRIFVFIKNIRVMNGQIRVKRCIESTKITPSTKQIFIRHTYNREKTQNNKKM